MNQLPTEIFNEVFTYLHQIDKVECLLVCRHWKNTIENFTLFHTVRVSTLESLDTITKKLKQEPSYGNQVERLALLITRPSVNPTQLLLLLPNLRALHIYNGDNRLLIDNGVQLPFLDNVRFIAENSRHSMLRSLLSVSYCANLTVLAITDFAESGITMLAHAPALVKLTLDLGTITFEGFEFIHEKLPLLQTIRMISMDVSDYEFYGEIKPAPLVTNCVFQYLEFAGESDKFLLKYLSQKYPNLSSFRYVNDIIMEEGDDVRINTQSWKPFFKTLGPKLESIAIRQERGLMDVVNIMDDANCQLKCLMLSSLKMGEDICKLSQSNQIKYIKELVLEDVHCKTFDWLEGLEVLEELTLVSCHSDTPLEIEITDVLNMCSPTTFKRLSIQHSKLSFDFEEAQPYHLTELSLDMAVFSQGLDKFISTYLSQLSRLELMKCKLEGRTFNFSTLKLSYLYIVEDFFPTDQDILVLTLEDNQKRWYTAESDHLYIGFYNDSNNGDIGLYPAAKSFPVDDVEAFPFFTILCHSVKDVIISNYQNFI